MDGMDWRISMPLSGIVLHTFHSVQSSACIELIPLDLRTSKSPSGICGQHLNSFPLSSIVVGFWWLDLAPFKFLTTISQRRDVIREDLFFRRPCSFHSCPGLYRRVVRFAEWHVSLAPTPRQGSIFPIHLLQSQKVC